MIGFLTSWVTVGKAQLGFMGQMAFVAVLLLVQGSAFGQQHAPPQAPPHAPLRFRGEMAALLELRSSLRLREGEWPRRVDPCAQWAGVRCLDGRVVGINLTGLRRASNQTQVPSLAAHRLANLTRLASFNSSGFALPGFVPDFARRHRALQVLDLRSSSVTGPIPPSLGNLSKLHSLYLSDNAFVGAIPETLGRLSALSVLDLARNLLTGPIPVAFASLGNLTHLDLSSNYLSGSIPRGIGNFSMLRFLNLSNNSLAAQIPAQLGSLSQLTVLDLSKNSLSGSLPKGLRGLRSLRKFIVGDNLLDGPLPDELFRSLTQLQLVVLCQNEFTDALPDVFWTLPELRLLDVSSNNLTGVLPINGSNMKGTDAFFNLSDNMFYGGLSSAVGLLRMIDLSGNYFQGKVFNGDKTAVTENCLTSVLNQRSFKDCKVFYAERKLTFDNFGEPDQAEATLPHPSRTSEKRRVIILAAALGGTGFFVLLLFALISRQRACNKGGGNQKRNADVGSAPVGSGMLPRNDSNDLLDVGRSFKYEQLMRSTESFSGENLIRQGHSGDLFSGILEDGTPVVIKRVDLLSNKKDFCLLELNFFSKASNPRLVPLLGYCLEHENEWFMVYKYMPNGDLATSLYRPTSLVDNGLESLDWITRLKVAIGAAEGLCYLHHECSPSIIHRDVQASSILLDDKFEVRIGSLSNVYVEGSDYHSIAINKMLHVPQTCEHSPAGMDNHFIGSSPATCAYDVYCFGKVLLQLATGKLGISSSDDDVIEWLDQTLPYISIHDKELVNTIVDPSLIVDEGLLEEVWAVAIVAKSCLNPKPTKRPTMKYVLRALENPLKVVREGNSSSARFRTISSRRSWSFAFFGSWRHSSSDSSVTPIQTNELPSSNRRYPGEITPEPN